MTKADIGALAWDKGDGLLPAIVQDHETCQVLMLGYMSREALAASLESGRVTFHSRSRGELWQKGQSSGNHLEVRSIRPDCDGDTLLVLAEPAGPACHLGTTSCFGETGPRGPGWLGKLARIVRSRRGADPAQSYTAQLLEEGRLKIAQKLGEEGVELALAGAAQDKEACIGEASDLLFHLTVLMEERGFDWDDIAEALEQRHRHDPS